MRYSRMSSWLRCVICLVGVVSTTGTALGQGYIEGKLFYNDLRKYGCFAWRQDASGNAGLQRRDEGESWLGAYDIRATLYELDFATTRKVDETYVLPNGHYFFFYDDSERDDQLEFAVEFELSYSTSRRDFKVTTGGVIKENYRYWHPAARPGAACVVSEGESFTLPHAYFGGQTPTGSTNQLHQAALIYASMVDVTRVWHEGDRWVDGEDGYRHGGKARRVPFGDEGTVRVRYPSPGATKGFGKSPTELLIGEVDYVIQGQLPMHEYGHVMQQRAWTHGYGWGAGRSDRWAGSDWVGKAIEPLRAFKEAWAEFVVIATMQQNGTDHRINDKSLSWHENRAQVDGRSGVDGHRWVSNIKRALTDWYDSDNDNSAKQPGDGDHFTASLYSVWLNMEQTWATASREDRERGLGFLDYVDYYINDRKSIARVGREEHERYRNLIGDLIHENGIGRGVRPSWPHGVRGVIQQRAVVSGQGRWRDRVVLDPSEILWSVAIPPLVSCGEVRVRLRAEGSFKPGVIVWDRDAAAWEPSRWWELVYDTDVLGFVYEDAGDREFTFDAQAGVPYQVDVHRTARTDEPFEFHLAVFGPNPEVTLWDMAGRRVLEKSVEIVSMDAVLAPRYYHIPELAAGHGDQVTITLTPNDGADVQLACFAGGGGDRLLGVADDRGSGLEETLSFGIEELQIRELWIAVMGSEFGEFGRFGVRVEVE